MKRKKIKVKLVIFLLVFLFLSNRGVTQNQMELEQMLYNEVFVIKKGESVIFPDRFRFTFHGHSHIRIKADSGAISPLLVSVSYQTDYQSDSLREKIQSPLPFI